MKANIHILVCFLLLFSLPVMAQHVNQKANRGAQSENVRQKKSLSDKLRIADSLRLELRRHADKGMMLQWGNSLLRARLDSGKLDNKTFQRLRKRLYKYDTMLHHGDSLLASNYRKVNFDTLYISRPNARWTIKLRFNLSGAKIKADGRKTVNLFMASCDPTIVAHSVQRCPTVVWLQVSPLTQLNWQERARTMNSTSIRMGIALVSILSTSLLKLTAEMSLIMP